MSGGKPATIDARNAARTPANRATCGRLRRATEAGLPGSEDRVRYAHPVWFLQGNPSVGHPG